MQSRELAARFEAYGDWRRRLSSRIARFHRWLDEQDLADAQVEPSSAGRTTMCPTELLHDPSRPPSIRLLPIETRRKDATVAEFKTYADEWVTLPLDLSSADRMSDALARVSQVKRVPFELARRYGLTEDGDDVMKALTQGEHGSVDIPCWRHAIINFPHPLLRQGLVILDTPGLNAIGTEPELTLSLLPQAHAILFILAADAGVTRTDLEVWNEHLAGEDAAAQNGRMVILNKIDGLWDDLKRPAEVEDEIARQVRASASMLDVPVAQCFAVSAQKALLAKVNGDDALLANSRLPELEGALSGRMIPAKRHMVGNAAKAEVRALADGVRARLSTRASGVGEQLAEMAALRGKNQDVVEHMLDRARQEKELFERGLARFTALRNVFTGQTNALFDQIGLVSLRANASRTRQAIEASPFTKGVRQAMGEFFATIRGNFDTAGAQSAEIHELMRAMYARFAHEYGLEPFVPPPFSVLKYQKEVDRLERAYNQHFNTLWNMVSKAKFALMRRFFETVASRAKHAYDVANRDADAWLRAVMAPLETQVKEHHLQLKRRLDSIKRIHRASDELEERIAELTQQAEALKRQIESLDREVAAIDELVDAPDVIPLAANG